MAGEFTDDGTETHFSIGTEPACVRAVSSGRVQYTEQGVFGFWHMGMDFLSRRVEIGSQNFYRCLLQAVYLGGIKIQMSL